MESKDVLAPGNKTVVLLGTSNTLENTVWDKPEYDYWACFSVFTEKAVEGHRVDAWFELHPIETWSLFENNLLKSQDIYPNAKIYMQKKVDRINNSVEYPLDEVQQMPGNIYMQQYFTSSIAYMIALAILKGYEKIILYGISLSVSEEEYSRQRSCAEAWLAYGVGRGVQFEIAQPSGLFRCKYKYGYEAEKDVIIKFSQLKEAAGNALQDLRNKEQSLHDEVKIQEGALRMMDYLIGEFRP